MSEALAARIELHVDGAPVGKGRPKFIRATGRTYTDRRTVVAEHEIKQAWRDAGQPRIDGAVWLDLSVMVVRPSGHFKKDGSLSKEGGRHPYPDNRKPDLDNALKLVCDALNKLAYEDDVRVVYVTMRRRWADHPYVHIILEPYNLP